MDRFNSQQRIFAQALFVFGIAFLLAGCGGTRKTSHQAWPPVAPGKISILIDSVHAHNALQPLTPETYYLYHYIYGYRLAFGFLKDQGVQVDEMTTGLINKKVLSGHQMLFINLVSGDLPPFLVSEIRAIKNYVKAGGSLLIITDHSNCYYHAYKLEPLLTELGIRSYTVTACDRSPNTIGSGNGWLAVTRFSHHPVTDGVHTIKMETAGEVDGRYAIAFTSRHAWADNWQVNPYGEGDSPGFLGNWRQDPGERSGRLGLVMAKQFGRGRIVIVGDQNMWGDCTIDYADNYRLWLNTIAWLTGKKSLANAAAWQQWKHPRVVAYEDYSKAAFGSEDSSDYYNLFVALGRWWPTFATNDLSGSQDLIVFAHDSYRLPASALNGLIHHLKSGKNVVSLGLLPPEGSSTGSVLAQIVSRLGQPTIHPGINCQIYSWPGCGEFIALPRNDIYRNSNLPSPETKPSDVQQAILTSVFKALNDAMASNR